MMGPEFRVGRLAAVALIGVLKSEIRFSRPPGRRCWRRGGHADQPAASRFASDRTRDRADMGPRRAAAPVFTSVEPGVSSIGLPIVRCPASGAARPDLCAESVSTVRSPPPNNQRGGRAATGGRAGTGARLRSPSITHMINHQSLLDTHTLDTK